MMILLICNICEIKINFIWLWISPSPSKSKILFKWLKNKTEIHSTHPLKEFSDMLEQARTVSSLCACRFLGWKRPEGPDRLPKGLCLLGCIPSGPHAGPMDRALS